MDGFIEVAQLSSATSTACGTGMADAAIVRVVMMEMKRAMSASLIMSSTNVVERRRGF